ncbi:MAG: T9SS type A sorting domain-containing protein, partial [Flavobacteriales bacterium]|nr:T9SS type A sorting domain-containing protein [Flavobacteriales bacterium]
VTLSGGASSVYTYFWSTGQQDNWVSTASVDGLPYGSYYVTTRDSLGCEVVDSIFISEPEPLSMEAMELDWVDCYNDATGEGTAMAVGGTAPYQFDWANGTWASSQGDTITTLTKGFHTVDVTDARGCTASDTIEIHNPDSLYINIIDSLTVLPYCMGVNTASLSAVAFGGTGSYIYEWDDNLILPQTTTIAANLLAGVYTVTVTDDKGCTAFDTRDIDTITNTMDADTVLVSQYASVSGVLDSNEVSCFGLNDGEVSVNAWGGHAPYDYQWYGPNSFSSVSSVITNLYAGTYSVTVRDTNDCMVNTSVILAEPLALTFNTSTVVDESCLGACDGEIFVDSIAGGVATYSALLTNNVTGVTTPHTMVNDETITGVCSGDYTVVLTDVNDCPSSVIVGGLNQQQVSTLVFTEADIQAIVDTICYAGLTGELTVDNPNTNTGYTYSWENANNPVQSIATTTTLSNLGAGTYMLLAGYNNTDGCIDTAIITITSLAMLNVTNYVVTDADCYGASTGEVAVTADPLGVTPYTYSWSSGATTATATTLSAGPHILTLTDSIGCEQDFSYTVNEPPAVNVNVVTSQTYILTANATGGTSPYTYSWRKQPSVTLGSNASYTVSSNGSYYVIVTDANGCEDTSDVILFGTTGLISTDGIALNIYPNPFKDETTVDFGRVIKEATITVIDVYGKLIETHKLESQDTYIIKRNTKASGVYFLEIEIEGEKSMIQKLIIE